MSNDLQRTMNGQYNRGNKPSKGSKKGSKRRSKASGSLPILVEYVFTFSNILLLAVVLIIAALSFISGASLMDILLRSGVALLVMGVLLWFLASILTNGILKAMVLDETPDREKEKGSETNMPVEKSSHIEV